MIRVFREWHPYSKERAVLIVVTPVAVKLVALAVVNVRGATVETGPQCGRQRAYTQVYVVGDEIELKLRRRGRANG